METASSCEIYGFISLRLPSLPDLSTTQSNFSASFPCAALLSVLLGQDYTKKKKTWILRPCGKSTENQRKYYHCINPWYTHLSNMACQYCLILGMPEDTYFICIFIQIFYTHTLKYVHIYYRHTHKHYTGEQRGRFKAWSSSQMKLHSSRSNLKIICKTKELNDIE